MVGRRARGLAVVRIKKLFGPGSSSVLSKAFWAGGPIFSALKMMAILLA